uniref:Uncharacterized protein n=1 Tax=Hyaloperonospora arabidopsidis (strain Emoy2) TaxID=559515 RepID=M4BPU1_HYAAE
MAEPGCAAFRVLGNSATFCEWTRMLFSVAGGLSLDETTPLPAEVPSVLRVQQLAIAGYKVNLRLPVGWFAENAEDCRTYFFGDVV